MFSILGKKRNKMKEQAATPKLYIGIDIHKRNWSVYTATDLFWGKQLACKPDPGELKQWVAKHFVDYEGVFCLRSGLLWHTQINLGEQPDGCITSLSKLLFFRFVLIPLLVEYLQGTTTYRMRSP